MPATRHRGIRLVQREVTPGAVQRVGADVQIGHRCRAAARRVNRETAGEAERIEHTPPLRQRFDSTPVFALIQEEAGLLSA